MSQDLPPPIRAGDLVTPELARSLRRQRERSMLRPKLRMWGKGLLMAVISGGANGFTAGLSAIVIAPDTFNGGAGLASTVKLIVSAGVMGAATGLFGYLAKSPLPPSEEEIARLSLPPEAR